MSWNKIPDSCTQQISSIHLENNWSDLHQGDCEPYPDVNWVEAMAEESTHIHQQITDTDLSYVEIAQILQNAWLAFHQGEFEQSIALASQVGTLGTVVSSKARGIYNDYLEDDEDVQLQQYEHLATESEAAAIILPEHANHHYFQAFGYGRYSQGISIVKALSQGLGGKIKKSLEFCISIQPEHAEAHLALGLYHAEVVDKIGSTMAKLTYGASTKISRHHFDQALELAPNSAIVHIEYGNGLMLLEGDKGLDKANEAYATAAGLTPIDAMSCLDIEFARSELE